MKRPTNAVLLGPAHPYRGGLADFDHLLARALNRAGIPCRLYTFTLQYPSFLFPGKSQFTDAPAPEGLDITRVLNSVNPLNWVRTGLRIRRERPDLLIVRYWIPQMAPALGTVCRIARRGGTRTVAIMDNVLPHESRPMDRLLTRYTSLNLTCWQGVAGLIALLPTALLESPRWQPVAWDGWMAVLFLALICSALCFFWYAQAIRALSPMQAAAFVNLNPLVAVLGGVLLLGEPVTLMQLAGGALIVGSILMINYGMSAGRAR